MTNKVFWSIIGKNIKLIIALIIVAIAAMWFFTVRKPVVYEANTLLILHKKVDPKEVTNNFYQYDNYYAIQAAGLETDNLSVIIASPNVVAEIYKNAGMEVPQISYNNLTKTFKTKKVATIDAIDIFADSQNQDEAKALVKSAAEVLKTKTDPKFNVEISEPMAQVVKQNLMLNLFVGAFIGLILGLLFAFGRGIERKENV